MYLKQIFFILICSFTYKTGSTQKSLSYTRKSKYFIFVLTIDSLASPMNSYFDTSVTTITIRQVKDNKIIQTIHPRENKFHFRYPNTCFELMDMNFDDNEDFRLLQFNKGINTSYLYWLYNPAKQKFEESKQLEEITSAYFDKENKRIISSWKGGDGYFGHDVYTYNNGKYNLSESREDKRNFDKEDSVLVTIRKRINGKLVITQKKYYGPAEYQKLPNGLRADQQN